MPTIEYSNTRINWGPIMGILVTFIVATIFWGSCAVAVISTVEHVTTGRAYRQVCERLVADGWRDVTTAECVALFRQAPE